jgi:flagellar basal-body rod protein FlgC
MSAVNSALSGLVVAQTRLTVSASNTVNQLSTAGEENGQIVNKPYVPQRVQAQTLASGEVAAVVLPEEIESFNRYDPASPLANEKGLVSYPNVSSETEVVNQQIAAQTYTANLKVLQTQDKMTAALLDIKE